MWVGEEVMPSEQRGRDQMSRLNLSGRQIRRLRRERGWTLAHIQAILEQEYHIFLDRTTLGRIERGTRAITDVEFGALREVLDVSEAELLWGTTSSTSGERKKALKEVKVRYSRPRSRKKRSAGKAEKRRSSRRAAQPSSE